MRATTWEFKNRALIFGILIFVAFAFYFLDPQNVTAAFSNAVEHRFGVNADPIARFLFFGATSLVALAALLRTWASAYLHANVVYASEIKTATLVADGPYRFVRNPLYLANVLMAIGVGTMMSRAGFFLVVLSMVVFCYRLILREEGELQVAQTMQYAAYLRAVPRLWPSLRPRVPASTQCPSWKAGFKAESWYWGFALALAAFAITLQIKWFFIVSAAGVGLLGALSAAIERKSGSRSSTK